MADPSTLAAGSTGATAAGSIVGAIGDIFSGDAKSNALKYQAAIAQMNAKVAEQNASYEREEGDLSALKAGLAGRFREGEIKAAQSGRGLDITRGTALNVQKSQTEITEMDQEIIQKNAAHKAYGFDVQAVNWRNQSNIDTMAASTAETEGYLSAASTLLGGAGKVAGQWYQSGMQFGGGGGSSDAAGKF